MNKTRLQLLANELRKPHITQIFGRLGNPVTCELCVLGVAMKLYEEQTGDELYKDMYGDYYDSELSHKVAMWYGFSNSGGSINGGTPLVRLNDVDKVTFTGIAKDIEYYIHGP